MKINPAMQAYTAHIQKKPAGMEDGKPGVNFGDLLKQELNKVNELQLRAEEANMQLITGEAESIHSVMLAAEEARLALELTVQIRNKLVEAYQEINRIQL
ncbi:MAG: flagellar hook-basal body complex protein FliE [Caldicoprobacterales bacterium]|jgi:flagellar hook-basal body complex protein FliE|nr:flagellar hook-basal body complex protein FliE [Clostridiales bacterium]